MNELLEKREQGKLHGTQATTNTEMFGACGSGDNAGQRTCDVFFIPIIYKSFRITFLIEDQLIIPNSRFREAIFSFGISSLCA